MKAAGLTRRQRLFFGLTAALAVVIWLVYAGTMLLPPKAPPGPAAGTPGERGSIFDRDGRLLAVSIPSETATLWRPQVKDLPALVRTLAPVLQEDPEALFQRLSAGSDFQYVKRRLSTKEAAALRDLKARGDLAGVRLEPEAGRSYPETDLAAGLVGYVGLDNVGLAGIEYTFNDLLLPPPPGQAGAGRGAAVWLTIDSVLQYAVQTLTAQALGQNQASRVNALVLEAQTGEVLVWAVSPGFDPNRFASYSEETRANTLLTRAYEPGSVFKIFSISTLLDAGVLKPTDTFEANGFYERTVASTGEVIRIKDLAAYGRLDVAGILEHSSNAGTGYASDRMDAPTFEAGLRRYGFGTSTGVRLNGETPGLLRPASTWSARSKPTIAMGQEIGVSALQIVQAATVLANDGVLLRPQVVRQVVGPDGTVMFHAARTEVRKVIQASTARTVLGMLQSTVEVGTGKRARVEGYDLAGKTGTAQVLDPATGRYSDKYYLASVLLFLPADKPRYIIYLSIENPLGASYLGGQIAAPVGKSIAEKLIQLRGLPRQGEETLTHPGSAVLDPPEPLVLGATVPDLHGLAKRSLLPLLDRPGLHVEIRGEGWVVRQSPPPGTPLTEDLTLTVDLE